MSAEKVLLFMGEPVSMPATERLIDGIRCSSIRPRVVSDDLMKEAYDADGEAHSGRITVDQYASAVAHAAGGFTAERFADVNGLRSVTGWRFLDKDEWMAKLFAPKEGE